MIIVDDEIVMPESYPDGTSLVSIPAYTAQRVNSDEDAQPHVDISWFYESEDELLRVVALGHELIRRGADVSLAMPYVPYARADAVLDDTDVLTLSSFAEILNTVGFWTIDVLDAHSEVASALIDRCHNELPIRYIEDACAAHGFRSGEDVLLFGNAGMAKSLAGELPYPYAVAVSMRDWRTGQDTGTVIAGDVPEGAKVMYVGDICSYGKDAADALRAAKAAGASECHCFFTHLEGSAFGTDDWERSGDGMPVLLGSGLATSLTATDSLITARRASELAHERHIATELDVIPLPCGRGLR